MTSTDASLAVAAVLEPGERLLWTGRPAQGLRLGDESALKHGLAFCVLVVAVLTTALTIYATWLAIRNGDHFEWPFLFLFALTGIGFCAAGYQFAVGRSIRDARRRAMTQYALSDRRAFEVCGGTVRSIPLSSQSAIERIDARDGLATLIFPAETPIAFQYIRDAERVASLVRNEG